MWLLRRNRAREQARAQDFGPRVAQRLLVLALGALLLGWFLFHGLPELLDTIRISQHRRAHERLGDWGATPFFAAIFAFVNIHHYFMDHVIWRRENPETRYLRD